MTSDLPKQYDPKAAREQWYPFWEERGYFDADPDPDRPPHAIMIPLPNVTGALHMGHALNGTCQDLVTRWRRMQGFEALWMPGTDHAGIATQAVVERRMLEEEGLTRHDVGREALVNRIWKWKDAYEQRILGQLKQLGASCDWRRTRFTLDEVCSKAVRRTFFKLFKDGLIYRGKRLVNWDTYLQTAVADDEVFEEEIDGHFWTFTYPVLERNPAFDKRRVSDADNPEFIATGETIAFSTTRPETMLGDTAVCVHPDDKRYTHLVGRKVRIPLNGREIPIIADGVLADPEMGTGAVKVTPAHDINDYECGQRNGLAMINILNPDGTVSAECGNEKYVGRDRYEVREMVIEDMEAAGHFVEVEDRRIPIKHSDRSKTPIEPYLSDQWFVKMRDYEDGRPGLAQMAIDAVEDGRVEFFPLRYARMYLDWLGEKRDWCISRQLWWGHRIPVWKKSVSVDDDPQKTFLAFNLQQYDYSVPVPDVTKNRLKAEFEAFVADQIVYDPTDNTLTLLWCIDQGHDDFQKNAEAAGFEQDPDVLDTWFSSALWPHSTLGWPDLDHDPPLQLPDGTQSVREARSHAERRNETPSTLNPQPSTGGNAVLSYFYPTSVLITSRDIVTLWVARMVLTGLYNMGHVPFRHVCVHPKILDGFGQTMSKSKGNGVDPVDLIDKYGTDAVRFTIASFAGETQDVRLPISYECPHCGESIPQKQIKTVEAVFVGPETVQGEFPPGRSGQKPRMRCPKCKQTSQFSSPFYDPDADEPLARTVSERFEYGRNFCNKLYNAARFALLNLEGYAPAPVHGSELKLEDRWILSRLCRVAAEVTACLDRYQFDAATRALRDFTWSEFCDWYLEMIKPRLKDVGWAMPTNDADRTPDMVGTAHPTERTLAQRVLVGVLDSLLRLLQPFTPFLCEELWQRLAELAPERSVPVGQASRLPEQNDAASQRRETAEGHPEADASGSPAVTILAPQPAAESVMIAPWPNIPAEWQDEKLEARFERLQEIIAAVRDVRAFYRIPPTATLELYVRCEPEIAADVESVAGQFENLAGAKLAAAGPDVQRPKASASFTLGETEGYIPLEGVIDLRAERDRKNKEAEKLRSHIKGHEKKLANENFVTKAPEEVVAQVRETLQGLKTQLESVEQIIADLSSD